MQQLLDELGKHDVATFTMFKDGLVINATTT
jgi:hypothetical protein